MIEAFKSKGGAPYLQKFNRFNNPDFFVPSNSGEVHTTWQKSGTGRYAESPYDYVSNRYIPGYNIQNI